MDTVQHSSLHASRSPPPPSRQRTHASAPHQSPAGAIRKIGVHKVARGLAWFSVGVGIAEILFPRTLAKMIGTPTASTTLLRIFGLREIAAGALIFNPGRLRATGMWARVVGDAADLSSLAAAYGCPNTTNRRALTAATAGVVALTALDVVCAREVSKEAGLMAESGALRVTKTITINRSPGEVYEFWRNLENLPRFMYHVEEVHVISPQRSRWTVKAPAGGTVHWNADITAEVPGEMLGWRTTNDADVENSGTVRFEPGTGGRGTVVRVDLEYRPPGHMAGAALAMMFNRSPHQQVEDDLRRLKQFLETGDLVRSDASPEGTGRVAQRPAQPSAVRQFY
ncbi:MAG: Cyclase/dehydrase [Betaproteobacteria bacterium]|nr:Cyclase/dehydrase [Betaproteobacteria bacterium]